MTPVFVIIVLGSEIVTLSPEQVLMIADVVEGRLRCETATRLDRGRRLLKYSKLIKILDHLDSLLPYLGNDTYDVQKMLEPLVQALIVLRDPGNHSDGAFLKFTTHTIMEVLDEHVPDPLTWMIHLQSLLNENTVDKIAEWLCLYRIILILMLTGQQPMFASIL